MATLGRLLLATHLVFLLYATILFAASFAGFLGAAPMVISAVLAFLAWGGYAGLTVYAVKLAYAVACNRSDTLDACLKWSNALFLTVAIASIATGLPLAFGAFASCGPLFLSPLYHWAGLIGSVLGFTAFYCLPLVVRACMGPGGSRATCHRWWVPLTSSVLVYGIWGLIWLIAYLKLSGSIDESTYPSRATSPFKLPFASGDSSWVIQGNNSSFNHNGAQQHSWDFRRRCGTPVLAARAGTVGNVIDTNDGNGGGKPNNLIEVDHGDGTIGRYLHIQKGSARLHKGNPVKQGEELAKVGNVGNSLTGHIHFVVERTGKSIPVTFQDVTEDKGIPRTFGSYTSGNH